MNISYMDEIDTVQRSSDQVDEGRRTSLFRFRLMFWENVRSIRIRVFATNKCFNQELSAPVSVLHWRSGRLTRKSTKSTSGRNLCSKFSSDGDDLDQSIVGIDDLERFRHSHAAKIESASENHDAACDPQRKSSLLRS